MLIWVSPYIYSNNHTLEVGEDKIYNLFLLTVSNLFQRNVYGTKRYKNAKYFPSSLYI